ncbi:MAG: TRAP transporter permease [Paracoccaceae bacterium]
MGRVDIFSNYISKAGYVLAGAFSLTVICVIAFFVLDEVTARFSVIALSALIVLMTQPGESLKFFENKKRLGLIFDLIIIGSFVWSAWWFFKVKEELWTGFYMATNSNVLAGLLGIISLIILTFRSWGWSLVIMAIVFIIFGFSGPWLPGLLEHFGVNIRDFMQIVWYSFDGVFGRTTGLVADNVLIFLIFGAVLERTGAGQSLITISTALTGRIRGGSAHAAIVASAVFGMMSGSVAANIAGTGVFTIPMIKKQGFSSNFAGAVEAAASSGGQLTPPIMAAAVFIMADLVGMPFTLVIAAAALPALFKYIGLFSQVYTEAIKIGIKPMNKKDIPSLTLNDWVQSGLIIFPILTLMLTFIWGKSPATAGLVGVLTAILAGFFLNPEFRRQPIRIFYAFADGGISSARIMLAVGVIGIVLAVVNETGVAIRFASSISSFGEDYLIFALILAMFGAMILGMGLPTLPAYLIIAIMIAPAIIKAGVLPLAAHMFVLYYAVYSSIVPPIAYGCYIAAPIAGGHPLTTAFIALRISIVGLMVPYVFVYSPSLLLVAGEFSWLELSNTILRLLAAIWMFGTALGGADPLLGNIKFGQRVIRFIVGCGAMIALPVIWIPACILALIIGLYSRKLSFNN